MTRLAVLGAGGFIGNRIVEMAVAEGDTIIPIVRRRAALALASRFDLEGRIADAFDQEALVHAFEGCTDLVCAIAGPPRTIVETIAPVYEAARRARLRRIVYLSSAMVHGQAPQSGANEDSVLSVRQPLAYNTAKIRAEGRLRELAPTGPEIVILRPGIVYGPRSRWTGGLADELLSGTAILADSGRGICNAIYVDNLVYAVRLALAADGVNGEAFLVNDREEVRWRDLFGPVAQALGKDLNGVQQPSSTDILRSANSFYRRVFLPAGRKTVSLLPKRLAEAQRAARSALRGFNRTDTSDVLSGENILETVLLQSCRTRLGSAKAERMLGYDPPTSFAEGCRRSLEWLRFAGYPVR